MSDLADVYIKNNRADEGSAPFIGCYWDESDIVIRKSDDGVFSLEPIKQGQTNYIYVRITNLGPDIARNVVVSAKAVAFTHTAIIVDGHVHGTILLYPRDWTVANETHLEPNALITDFANLSPKATALAKFSLSPEQVDQIRSWETAGWHACIIAVVKCENDHEIPTGIHSWENNNLAHRNVSTIMANR